MAVHLVSRDVMTALQDWSARKGEDDVSDYLEARARDLTWRHSEEGCAAGGKCISSLTEMASVFRSGGSPCDVALSITASGHDDGSRSLDAQEPQLGESMDAPEPDDLEGRTQQEYNQDALESSRPTVKTWGDGNAYTGFVRGHTPGGFAKHIESGAHHGELGSRNEGSVALLVVCSDPQYSDRKVQFKIKSDFFGALAGRASTETSLVGASHARAQGYIVGMTTVQRGDQDTRLPLVQKSIQVQRSSSATPNWRLVLDLAKLAADFFDGKDFDPKTGGHQASEDAKNAAQSLSNGLIVEAGDSTAYHQQVRANATWGLDTSDTTHIFDQGIGLEVSQSVRVGLEAYATAVYPQTATAETAVVNDFVLAGSVHMLHPDRSPDLTVAPAGFFIVSSQPAANSSEFLGTMPNGRSAMELASVVNGFFTLAGWTNEMKRDLEARLQELRSKDFFKESTSDSNANTFSAEKFMAASVCAHVE